MAVYCIDSGAVGLVRIGFTGDLKLRLVQHNGASPVPLTVAGIDPLGDRLTEAEVHWRLRAYRAHSDWFRKEPEVMRVVSEIARTSKVPGGWYLPPSYKTMGPRCFISMQQMFSRYGLAWGDMKDIRPGTAYTARDVFKHVTIPMLPPLIAFLRARGTACEPGDFFVQPLRLAVA